MAKWNLLYDFYERRLQSGLSQHQIPHHVGVILDGNRRWARSIGTSPSHGHRVGAGKIAEFLEWADGIGVEIVTLWMLSTENLQREQEVVSELLFIITGAVQALADTQKWKIKLVGDLSLLPKDVAEELGECAQRTADVDGMTVNIAVGYGGRQEITGAVRSFLKEAARQGRTLDEVASTLSDEDIADHLYTKGQPDPDLVIRTSGEQRMSGFMMWQSAHSEFYFCEAYWPDFRRVDFLRAMRSYAQRERRMGR